MQRGNADLGSAVSQSSTLRGAHVYTKPQLPSSAADWKSAIQQTGGLRYVLAFVRVSHCRPVRNKIATSTVNGSSASQSAFGPA